jgi:hypothetical protein
VVGVHAVGDDTISIDGFTASTTGIMKAGDVIKFASHSKVYMVTADGDSVAGGAVTLSIVPPLIDALADNEVVTVSNVQFTMSADDDVITWKGSAPNLASMSLNMTESL